MATAAPRLLRELPQVEAVRAAIARVRAAGTALAHATAQEVALVREKPARKAEAIRRLMDDPGGNPLTSRPHSASSAAAVAETDAGYAGFLRQCSEATVGVIVARSECTATRLEAQLALALVLDDYGTEEGP